jgi:hypothetical protein
MPPERFFFEIFNPDRKSKRPFKEKIASCYSVKKAHWEREERDQTQSA